MNDNSDYKNERVLEVLIIIGILAILVSVYLKYLKPFIAELSAQKKDPIRIQDLSSINSAIAKLRETNPNLSLGKPNKVYISLPSSSANCQGLELPPLPDSWEYRCKLEAEYRKIDGNGWMPVDFAKLSNVPFKELPIDAINDAKNLNYYGFVGNEKSGWVLTAMLESKKYQKAKALTDNGADPARFEIGSDLQLWTKASGLVGYWKFDEGQGQIAKDSSGNGNDGILKNSPAWVNDKIGKALSFDGIDNYIDVGNVFNNFYSVTTWIYLDNIVGSKPIVNNPIQFKVIDNKLRVQWHDGTNWRAVDSAETLNSNTWYHVALVHDGTTARFYKNGIKDTAIATISNYSGYTPGTVIGRDGTTGAEKFKGLIDEVRIYNRALSAEEVRAIYNATK